MPLEAQLGHFIASLKASADYAKVSRKKHEEEQEVYRQKQDLWKQYESLVSAQTENVKNFLSLFEKLQRATECRTLIEAITASDTFKKYNEVEQRRWLNWTTSIVDKIDPVTAFEMPELIDEQNCLAKAVFARAFNVAGLNVKLPVPPLSLREVSRGLEELSAQNKK